MTSKLTFIDLFSGCGGLSLGLKMSGFKSLFAVEKARDAAATYHHNFIDPIEAGDYLSWSEDYQQLDLVSQIQKGLVVRDIQKVLTELEEWSDAKKQSLLKIREVDLIAGGPPCQGFSMAGRRNSRDKRNRLPWAFLDFVNLVQPKAVIMENVEGMTRDFLKHQEKSPFLAVAQQLQNASREGYLLQLMLLNAKYYGIPQNRSRLFVVGIRKDLVKDELTTSGSIFQLDQWLRDNDVEEIKKYPLIPTPSTPTSDEFVTVKKALYGLPDENNRRKKLKTKDLESYVDQLNIRNNLLGLLKNRGSQENVIYNHGFRKHTAKVRARFVFLQVFGDQRDVLNWQAHGKRDEVNSFLKQLGDGVCEYKCEHLKFGFKRIDGWEITDMKGRKCLKKIIQTLQTKKFSQKVLQNDKPSPTIMTIPDDHVHPVEPRVLTVREQARIQSFPDVFEFIGPPTTGGERRKYCVPQYTQVGNAVPPLLAKAIGMQIRQIIKKK